MEQWRSYLFSQFIWEGLQPILEEKLAKDIDNLILNKIYHYRAHLKFLRVKNDFFVWHDEDTKHPYISTV